MTRVLALTDHEAGTVAEESLETLTFAREQLPTAGDGVESVVLGGDAAAVADKVAGYGTTRVHHVSHPLVDDYNPSAWGLALAWLVEELQPAVVLAPGTDRGNEVMAQLAARADLPLATNCIEVNPDGEEWTLTRLRWGGILYEDAALSAPVKLLSVAPHALRASAVEGGSIPEVSAYEVELDGAMASTGVSERVTRAEGVTLATAPVVVSGGRGVGSAEGFAVLEELADLLGGAVGCSRVVTNNGWRPHSDQVGQTGTKVAPDLYFACGISGATQHWVGCMSSKTILAINTDPEAAMVNRADYAVLGDVHEVLPALVEEVRKRKAA